MVGHKGSLFVQISMPEEAKKAGVYLRISKRDNAASFIDNFTNQRLHWHDHVHMWYTISGEYSNTVFGREHWLSEGGLVIIPPFVPHATGGREGQPITVVCMDMSTEFIKRIVPSDKQHVFLSPTFRDYSPGALHLSCEDREYVSSFFMKLNSECKKSYHRAMVLYQDQIHDFLCFLADRFSVQSDFDIDSRDRAAITRAINYISDHLSEPLHLSDMCRVTALSRAAFCKLFKEQTGNTFSEFLSMTRISCAGSLVCNTNLPISQIMRNCGFNSKSNFIRLFKELYVCTPRELRKAYMQNDYQSSRNFLI